MAVMIVLAAAALVTLPPQPKPVGAVAQATATIRIVAAVQLKLDGSPNAGAPPPRNSVITASDGSRQRVKLIEFQ
jgi:hypothetical protein